jgi:cytochrome c551/c552
MMSRRKLLVLIVLTGIAAVVLAACAGQVGPVGPAGPAGSQGEQGPAGSAGSEAMVPDLSCKECHNDTTKITGKKTAWSESGHGSGEAYVRGTSSSCAGCHSGGGFSTRIAAGLNPDEVEVGDPNPTRQDCRACHQIHTTFTGDDFALETTDAVTLFATGGTFALYPPDADGIIEVNSTHWGPHYGAEAPMLMGLGGAGVEGSPSGHALAVEDTCVTCHLGEDKSHTFEPDDSTCTACHVDAEDFDINGVQTKVEELGAEVLELLEAKGMFDDGPVIGFYPEAEAHALWNYIFVIEDDTSKGVHNSKYAIALLEAAVEALGE